MLRRLLLLVCSACLVAGVAAAVGGGTGAALVGCGSPSPSPSPAGAPCAPTAPTGKITAQIPGPPKQMQVTATDLGSGIQAFTNIVISNGTYAIGAFVPGTTSGVVFTATKSNPNMVTSFSFDVVDMAGNIKHCA